MRDQILTVSNSQLSCSKKYRIRLTRNCMAKTLEDIDKFNELLTGYITDLLVIWEKIKFRHFIFHFVSFRAQYVRCDSNHWRNLYDLHDNCEFHVCVYKYIHLLV